MIPTHAARTRTNTHTHTEKMETYRPRTAASPPPPAPSSSHTHIHVTRGFLIIKTSTSKQRFLGNYGKALSPEAAGGLGPRGAFGREELLGPEGGPWPQPGGVGRRPVHSVCRPRLSPKGPGGKKTLVGFGLKNKIQNEEKNRSVGITATPARRAL